MSEIQKAIDYFETQKKLFPNSFNVLSGYLDIAIKALKEQTKRCSHKQPCGWCSLFDKPCKEVCGHDLTKQAEPENIPLTLEQLRQMDGKPVWCEQYSRKAKSGVFKAWGIIDVPCKCVDFLEWHLDFEYFGKSWVAYVREPVSK